MQRLLVLLVALSLLSGCKPVKEAIGEAFYIGTVEGMGMCLDGMRTDLISQDTAKAFCSSRYELRIPPPALEQLTGNAGPRTSWSGRVFSGTLKNGTESYVVTKVSVIVVVFEPEGKNEKSYEIEVQGWFEPNQTSQDFESLPVEEAPEDWGQETLPYCKTPRTGRCWSWNIVSAEGLKL